MKKTFTLLTTLLLSVAMYAYPKQSTITVSTMGTNSITVIIDGKQYRPNNNYVTINNLPAGFHAIKIYQQANGRRPNRFNNLQMIYNSNMFVKPQYDVDIIISRFGKVFIDEQLSMDNNDENWNHDNNDWNNHDNNWNNHNNNYPNYQTMTNREFDQLKQTIKNEAFDDTKQSIAKQVISSNFFTSNQVKEIVQLFVFESSKMEIAKYAFKYTVDQNNYFTLLDAFTFSSSKSELLEYIQKNK